MRARVVLLAALLLVAVVAIVHRPAEAQRGLPPTGFEVEQAFPTLPLPGLEDGRPRSLADFRGQKLILHVFASW